MLTASGFEIWSYGKIVVFIFFCLSPTNFFLIKSEKKEGRVIQHIKVANRIYPTLRMEANIF